MRVPLEYRLKALPGAIPLCGNGLAGGADPSHKEGGSPISYLRAILIGSSMPYLPYAAIFVAMYGYIRYMRLYSLYAAIFVLFAICDYICYMQLFSLYSLYAAIFAILGICGYIRYFRYV